MFPDVAGGCETRITKPLSLLRVALSCRVLRSRWCQSGQYHTRTAQRCHPRLVLLGLNGEVSPQAIEPYPVPTTVPMLTCRKPDATADNCCHLVSWVRLFCSGFLGVCSKGFEPATCGLEGPRLKCLPVLACPVIRLVHADFEALRALVFLLSSTLS